MRWLFVAALVVGCSAETGVDEATGDGGADAGACPDYKPTDAGVVLIRRGCPLTIDYAIH